MNPRTFLCALVVLSVALQATAINTRFSIDAAAINRIVIFGDDYSDMYNLYNATRLTPLVFPNPIDFDGFEGPVCNGPLWWKYMLDEFINKYNDLSYTTDVLNFAYIFANINSTARPAAATPPFSTTPVFGIVQQVGLYFQGLAQANAAGAAPVPNTLHIIFGGLNDLLHPSDPANPTAEFGTFITELLTVGLQILGNPLVGADSQVLYVSLPSQASSPFISAALGANAPSLDLAIGAFNGNLYQAILNNKNNPTFGGAFRNLEWVDITAEWARMAAKPAQYGMGLEGGPHNDPVGVCANFVIGTPSSAHCPDVDEFYWWNPIWTSAVAHRWLGKRIFLEAFKQGQEEFETSYY